DENQSVEKKRDDFPKTQELKTGSRLYRERGMPAEINAGGNCRQNSRNMQTFRGQMREKWREQRDRNLDRRVVEMPLHPADDQTDQQSKNDASDRRPNKTQCGISQRKT